MLASVWRRLQISPWHDIPLFSPDGYVHMVTEIPKFSRAKFEIATGEPYNPIKQDTKNGKLREYKYGDMCFNYGAFPQTWEDPAHKTPDTGCTPCLAHPLPGLALPCLALPCLVRPTPAPNTAASKSRALGRPHCPLRPHHCHRLPARAPACHRAPTNQALIPLAHP